MNATETSERSERTIRVPFLAGELDRFEAHIGPGTKKGWWVREAIIDRLNRDDAAKAQEATR